MLPVFNVITVYSNGHLNTVIIILNLELVDHLTNRDIIEKPHAEHEHLNLFNLYRRTHVVNLFLVLIPIKRDEAAF